MELNYRDREKTLLDRELWLSREDRSRMTLISGEPLSGKTSLSICQAREALVLEGKRHVHPDWLYFKAGGRSENLLVRDFREEVEQVNEEIRNYLKQLSRRNEIENPNKLIIE